MGQLRPVTRWRNSEDAASGHRQHHASNRTLNRLQVVPVTSRTGRVYPCEALVDLNGELRKAMADQIATVSKQRLGTRIGVLSESDLRLVDAAIRIQLGLVR